MADLAGAPPATGRTGRHHPAEDEHSPGAHRPAGGGRGLGGWVSHHQGAAVALGGGAAVVTYLIMRQSPGTSAGATTSQTGVSAGPDPGVYGYGDGSASYDAMATEMQSLQDSLAHFTGATSPSVPPAPRPPQPVRLPAPRPPQPVRLPAPRPAGRAWVKPRTITVGRGQTLLSLSRQYLGTSNRSALAHANGLGTGAGLRTGQRLTVPGHRR